MAGRGPAPKPAAQRRSRHAPTRGEWQATPGIGWQHGPIPEPPDGLLEATRTAWRTWFQAWFAAHWGPEDVPVLRMVARLFDVVERGRATGAERSEFRQLAASYGVTPAGQQDRRWVAPKVGEQAVAAAAETKPSRYQHLRTVVG